MGLDHFPGLQPNWGHAQVMTPTPSPNWNLSFRPNFWDFTTLARPQSFRFVDAWPSEVHVPRSLSRAFCLVLSPPGL